ncbi:MAG: hypothetical protein IIB62_09835 [Proteobacteria bacterium]|nr:hypothetical protein [Pseudomonadota bacterium]
MSTAAWKECIHISRKSERPASHFAARCTRARCRRAGRCIGKMQGSCAGLEVFRRALPGRMLGLVAALAERCGR